MLKQIQRGSFKTVEFKVGTALRAVRFEAARYGEHALPSAILKLVPQSFKNLSILILGFIVSSAAESVGL